MGCASSKQHKRKCQHCQKRSLSPVRRSYSMNLAGHRKKENNYHVVALKSSTVGSLKLDFSSQPIPLLDGYDVVATEVDNRDKLVGEKLYGNLKLEDAAGEELKEEEKKNTEFPAGVLEAKIWSKMIEDKIPKVLPRTPTRTPPGEPETINAWELMEGLEDVISPFRSPRHQRSFSYSGTMEIDDEPPEPEPKIQAHSPRPMWLQMEEDDRVPSFTVPDFDPDVISTFRESFEEQENRGETKPKNDYAADEPKKPDFTIPELISALRKSLDEEAARKEKEMTFETEAKRESFDFYPKKCGKEKAVLYFTSLRGVRKTYENCCHVRVILKGLGVRVDERDVSMHSGFRDELRELIGDKSGVLPAVFIGKEFIGGVEEIRHMHEDGQLEKLLAGCERAEQGGGVGGGACEVCGDVRFVPCETCNGSCKVYYEEDGDAEEEVGEFGFLRCPDCNENGLIRCPNCCCD